MTSFLPPLALQQRKAIGRRWLARLRLLVAGGCSGSKVADLWPVAVGAADPSLAPEKGDEVFMPVLIDDKLLAAAGAATKEGHRPTMVGASEALGCGRLQRIEGCRSVARCRGCCRSVPRSGKGGRGVYARFDR